MRYLYCLCIFFMLPLGLSAQKAPLRHGQLLIHLPDSSHEKAMPLLICFGGSMWATPHFLWEETPDQYFEKAIIVYSPCYVKGGKGLRKVELEVLAFLVQKGIKVSKTSICGFSSGGPDAMIAAEPEYYQAIGLIDCSPKANGRVQYCSNMIFSFRRNNWIFSDYYGAVVNFRPFNELISKIQKAGGYTEETDIQHKDYFQYFLNKFEQQLIGD
jgi:hypothetical protein